jgi:hypothetical protein
LQALTDQSFWVKIQADCGTETLDRSLCVEANIEPDAPCLSPLNGPLLIAEGRCEGDSVRFEVRNIGLPMTKSQPYIVVEDNVMFLQGMELLLDAGEILTLSFPANGSTWRLEVLQASGTPDWLSDPHVAAVVEGCSASGNFSTGYVNQFSLYDGGYFSETECRPVVANAQGQEKVAFPIGWNAEHLIPANTDIEYELHYQNTSGDSVRVLTLRDTLDHLLLDPESVLPGPASHPYEFELRGAGVANFRFLGPGLADSSRAWVKFRVSQQPDLPAETVIYNHAWAYPDFAGPVSTNKIFHTIGSPLLSETGENPKLPEPSFKLWPVPTTSGLTIAVEDSGHYACQLTDLLGRLVLEKAFSGNLILISDQELPPGVFTATIFKDNFLIGKAKVIKLSP